MCSEDSKIKVSEKKFEEYELYYKSAKDMFMNEHNRWYGWTYIFLGVIAAVFYLSKNFPNPIPEYVPFFFAAFVSFLWLIVILNIAASTNAWHNTLLKMEKGLGLKDGPFSLQKGSFEKPFSRRRFFWSTFGIKRWTEEFDKDKCGLLFLRSVTRTLTVLALAMIFLFSSIAIWYFIQKPPEETYINKDLLTALKRVPHFQIGSTLTAIDIFLTIISLFLILGIIIRIIDCCCCLLKTSCINNQQNQNAQPRMCIVQRIFKCDIQKTE